MACIPWLNNPIESNQFNQLLRWCKVPSFISLYREKFTPCALLEGTIAGMQARRLLKPEVRGDNGKLVIKNPECFNGAGNLIPPIHLLAVEKAGWLSVLAAITDWKDPFDPPGEEHCSCGGE